MSLSNWIRVKMKHNWNHNLFNICSNINQIATTYSIQEYLKTCAVFKPLLHSKKYWLVTGDSYPHKAEVLSCYYIDDWIVAEPCSTPKHTNPKLPHEHPPDLWTASSTIFIKLQIDGHTKRGLHDCRDGWNGNDDHLQPPVVKSKGLKISFWTCPWNSHSWWLCCFWKKSGPIFLDDEAVNPGVIFLRWWEIWTSNQLRHPMLKKQIQVLVSCKVFLQPPKRHYEQPSSYTIDEFCSTMPWKMD